MVEAVGPEEQQAADGRNVPPLTGRRQTKRVEIGGPEGPDVRERGRRLVEAHRLGLELRHGLLVERLPAREAAHLGEHFPVSSTVRRTDSHVRPLFESGPGEVVWTEPAGVHADGQYVRAPESDELDVRQQPRQDRVADEARDPFLQGKRVAHAANGPAAVLDADQNRSAGRVGESDDRPEHSARG